MAKLSHFDEKGASRMVDVGRKRATQRVARARATVEMRPETLRLVVDKRLQKGDVFEVARLAGIMAAKQTHALIPLCHPLPLENVTVDFRTDKHSIEIRTEARVTAKTGVEMEALTAAAVAALTIYDMCKAVEKGIVISRIELLEKSGGKSGVYRRKGKEV
ncbi:MAG: cyclic pyranopterin monophosphate synthase MoaC [Candidatus Abyssobacteria bacterium SURF_17]|uniref:Cyclic pyranopterin monophosphate synthase n=1 Tax=Candidatus Abyssobacteria bacterium SURF_17 TaxID=2093361 RepID=A0A419F5K0_9BACT|nr:MAG: cyclic pyranopterin monophosphate synthase MoaC [Candidatus Abyssubacteria bacterium SURF_17]